MLSWPKQSLLQVWVATFLPLLRYPYYDLLQSFLGLVHELRLCSWQWTSALKQALFRIRLSNIDHFITKKNLALAKICNIFQDRRNWGWGGGVAVTTLMYFHSIIQIAPPGWHGFPNFGRGIHFHDYSALVLFDNQYWIIIFLLVLIFCFKRKYHFLKIIDVLYLKSLWILLRNKKLWNSMFLKVSWKYMLNWNWITFSNFHYVGI